MGTEQSNLDRALNFLSIFVPSQAEMERIAEIKMKYQSMLFEPRLLFKNRKDCIAFLTAFRLFNSYKSKSVKGEDVKRSIATIRLYDEELAEDIERILPFVDKNSDEIEYLIRYRNDVVNWPRYDDTYLIDFFIRRIKLFLDGGVEEVRGGQENTLIIDPITGEKRVVSYIRFMGIEKDFRDLDSAKTIKENHEVRNLQRFNEQVRFLKFLIGLCRKAQADPERWEGFYGKDGFWTNFNRWAKAFDTVFGNKTFARSLMEKKHEIGETPEGWGGKWGKRYVIDPITGQRKIEEFVIKDGELTKLLSALEDHLYQKHEIVLPASLALYKILEAHEKRLKEDAFKKFSRLLRGRKKSIIKNLKREMGMFVTHITEAWTEYGNFLEKVDVVVPKMEWWYVYEKTGELFNAAQRYRAHVKQQLSRAHFLSELTGLIEIDAIDASRAEAKRRIWQYQTFNHLTEEDFANMQEIILIAERVKSKLRTIESYVEFQLARQYKLTLKEMEREDFTRLRNRNFQFSYVKNIFGRLI